MSNSDTVIAHESDIKTQLKEAADAEASEVHTREGFKDTWRLLVRSFFHKGGEGGPGRDADFPQSSRP